MGFFVSIIDNHILYMEVIDIYSKRGETWQGFSLTIKDSLSAPINLTNSQVQMQLKTDSCDIIIAKEFSLTNGSIVLTNALSGQLQIIPTVLDISPKNYVYDLKITLQTGTILFPIGGRFSIIQNVTR